MGCDVREGGDGGGGEGKYPYTNGFNTSEGGGGGDFSTEGCDCLRGRQITPCLRASAASSASRLASSMRLSAWSNPRLSGAKLMCILFERKDV